MSPGTVLVEVDDREAASGVVDLLAARDEVRVEICRLAAADFCVNGRIFVERKTAQDFVASVATGRVFRQAARLRVVPGRSLLVIEGYDLLGGRYHIPRRAVRGAIVSLSVSWRLPVVQVADMAETVDLLVFTGRQHFRHLWGGGERDEPKPTHVERLRRHVLQGLPGVGKSTAEKLLLAFGSIEKVITAGEDELMSVKGMGPGKAAAIRRLVTGKVEPHQLDIDLRLRRPGPLPGM
jgi:DNA excision repair protein ERCC-4